MSSARPKHLISESTLSALNCYSASQQSQNMPALCTNTNKTHLYKNKQTNLARNKTGHLQMW